MRIDENNPKHVIADEGKVLMRKSDRWVAGEEILLGYTYYLGGVKLDNPLLEKAEDYTEADNPSDENEE